MLMSYFKVDSFIARAVFIIVAMMTFSACGIVGEKGTNQSGSNIYYESVELPRTEIPEEYDDSRVVDLYPVPPLDEAADESLIDPDKLPIPTPVTNDAEGLVQLQVLSDHYWVLVKETPSQVWAKLKQFSELNDLSFQSEAISMGIIDVADDKGILYRFKVNQGLQRKSSEISLRTLAAAQGGNKAFPAASIDKQLEVDTLEALTVFLTGHNLQTAYSYAALGISTNKRIHVKSEPESGIKYLLISEGSVRTKASLKQALTGASFQLEGITADGMVEARYMPQLPEEDQPGFLLRLFGVSPKLFDEDIEFAGETYIFSLEGNESIQKLSINKLLNADWESSSSKKRELNTILMMVKRSLY